MSRLTVSDAWFCASLFYVGNLIVAMAGYFLIDRAFDLVVTWCVGGAFVSFIACSFCAWREDRRDEHGHRGGA